MPSPVHKDNKKFRIRAVLFYHNIAPGGVSSELWSILALYCGNAHIKRAGVGDVDVVANHVGAFVEPRNEDVGLRVFGFAVHPHAVHVVAVRSLVYRLEACTALIGEGEVFKCFAALDGALHAHLVAHFQRCGFAQGAVGIVHEQRLFD